MMRGCLGGWRGGDHFETVNKERVWVCSKHGKEPPLTLVHVLVPPDPNFFSIPLI